jgi:chromosome partitioning protein
MGKVIAIANQKGGVGKTTTTVNLGASLALEGKKILIIDLDQQANATISLGLSRETVTVDSLDFMIDPLCLTGAIIKTEVASLDIIPASIRLSRIDELKANDEKKKWALSDKLMKIKDGYDFILIDCPPSLGTIVDNALYASDSVIIPVECGFFAYDALTQMVKKINDVQNTKDLTIEGILLTKLDNRNTLGFKIVDKVRYLFPNKTFQTVISTSSHIQEAPMHGKSVISFSYNSRGSKEYRDLAKEILMNNNAGGKDAGIVA